MSKIKALKNLSLVVVTCKSCRTVEASGIGVIARRNGTGICLFKKSLLKPLQKDVPFTNSEYYQAKAIEESLNTCLAHGFSNNHILIINGDENCIRKLNGPVSKGVGSKPMSHVIQSINLLKKQFTRPVRIIGPAVPVLGTVDMLAEFAHSHALEKKTGRAEEMIPTEYTKRK